MGLWQVQKALELRLNARFLLDLLVYAIRSHDLIRALFIKTIIHLVKLFKFNCLTDRRLYERLIADADDSSLILNPCDREIGEILRYKMRKSSKD